MITLTREEAKEVVFWLKHYQLPNPNDLAKMISDKLAQPEPEPVAWAVVDGDKIEHVSYTRSDSESWLQYVATRKLVPLYTAPPQREWQGLTDEEAAELCHAPIAVIEAKLKAKNT